MLETVKQARVGSIIPVYKELNQEIDAFEYFAKLSNYGRKKNSLLIENNNKSIGTASPCLVLTGKGDNFEIKALNEAGKRFLKNLYFLHFPVFFLYRQELCFLSLPV